MKTKIKINKAQTLAPSTLMCCLLLQKMFKA